MPADPPIIAKEWKMNIQTITMERRQARTAFLDYRRALRLRHSAEDLAIMKGYGALSRGKPVIILQEVIRAGGADEAGRPKLAIARSDQKQVRMRRDWRGSCRFWDGRWTQRNATSVSLASGTLAQFRPGTAEVEAVSIVPIVPAGLRPVGDLKGYWTLFEATWADVPRDPALLRSLGGGLYTVLATWDLTPLEAAVLGMTRR